MLRAIKEGYGSIFQNKFNRIAIVAVILISMLFGLICVTAFWSPEEKLKEFPVAVINLDKGTYGDGIIENLKKSDQAKWKFYEEDIFEDGIENTDYSFGFLIPENFSESVQSAQNGTPEAADIVYYSNMRKNFLMSQFSRNVKAVLANSVSSSITREYATGAFDTLYDIKDGLSEADLGSESLNDGSEKLVNGISDFSDGINQLNTGAASLTDNSGKFNEKMVTFAQGTTVLKTGANSLNENLKPLTAAVSEIDSGMNLLSENMNTLGGSVTKSAIAYQTAMDSILTQYAAVIENPYLSNDDKVAALGNIYTNLNMAYGQYKAVQEQINPGIAAIVTGTSDLKNGTNALNAKIPTLTAGVGTLTAGAQNIDDAAQQLQAASTSLYQGSQTLSSGVQTMQENVTKLSTGAQDLHNGMNELHIELADSAGNMKENLVNSPSDMGTFISEPLTISSNIYGEV
ncbi:MAG: YhgE/Pip family protein, partial [Clostridiales Family XIII bacterium]|nr:YhgE/Pip family protein [Clostridiales Family XIII bacterium]